MCAYCKTEDTVCLDATDRATWNSDDWFREYTRLANTWHTMADLTERENFRLTVVLPAHRMWQMSDAREIEAATRRSRWVVRSLERPF